MKSINASSFHHTALAELMENGLDITAPLTCTVQIDHAGKLLWININDICVLRVCKILDLQVLDLREVSDERA